MAHAEVILVQSGREVPLGVVGHDERCHLGLVDDLARLQLAARRLGWSIRLRAASDELRDLLGLVGLADALPAGPAASDREPGATRAGAPRDRGWRA